MEKYKKMGHPIFPSNNNLFILILIIEFMLSCAGFIWLVSYVCLGIFFRLGLKKGTSQLGFKHKT